MPARKAPERASRQFRSTPRYVRRVKSLGLAVRALRQAHGWTLEQAAARMDLDFKHLQKIEAGQLNLTFATFLRLADGLGEPPARLLALEGAAPTEPDRAAQDQPTRGKGTPRDVCSSNPSVAPRGKQGPEANGDAPGTVRRVGRRIAELRRQHGRTQAEFAGTAGVSTQYLRRVEAGANLTITSLARFAELLGVTIRELFDQPADPDAAPSPATKRSNARRRGDGS